MRKEEVGSDKGRPNELWGGEGFGGNDSNLLKRGHQRVTTAADTIFFNRLTSIFLTLGLVFSGVHSGCGLVLWSVYVAVCGCV